MSAKTVPGKFVLGFSALVFISYGLVSLISPHVPAGFAGLVITNGNAYAEIASMYGGLQTGVGLFCLLAIMRPEFYRAGLVLLVIGIGALAAARLMAVVVNTEPVSAYTYGALVYEFITTVLAASALKRSDAAHTNN